MESEIHPRYLLYDVNYEYVRLTNSVFIVCRMQRLQSESFAIRQYFQCFKKGANLFVEHLWTAPAFNVWSWFHLHTERFTILTDWEASMARMEKRSVSSRVCARDEKLKKYYDHVLQNCMKSAFSLCVDDSSLQKINFDFKAVKHIVEGSKPYGRNQDLPFGYRLIEDGVTRFGTLFLVTESFIKSSCKVWYVIIGQGREIARE